MLFEQLVLAHRQETAVEQPHCPLELHYQVCVRVLGGLVFLGGLTPQQPTLVLVSIFVLTSQFCSSPAPRALRLGAQWKEGTSPEKTATMQRQCALRGAGGRHGSQAACGARHVVSQWVSELSSGGPSPPKHGLPHEKRHEPQPPSFHTLAFSPAFTSVWWSA
jgi:hypothetical protein